MEKTEEIRPIKYIVDGDVSERKGYTWRVWALVQEEENKPPRKIMSMYLNYYDDEYFRKNEYHFNSIDYQYPQGFAFGGSLIYEPNRPSTRHSNVGGRFINEGFTADSLQEACDHFFGRYGESYEIQK